MGMLGGTAEFIGDCLNDMRLCFLKKLSTSYCPCLGELPALLRLSDICADANENSLVTALIRNKDVHKSLVHICDAGANARIFTLKHS